MVIKKTPVYFFFYIFRNFFQTFNYFINNSSYKQNSLKKMNVNNPSSTSSTGAIFFQGVRHIRKVQKTSKINLTMNPNGNRSLSRLTSIDSKSSLDEKLPIRSIDSKNSIELAPTTNSAIKKQTIFIYANPRKLSNSNAHSTKLLSSRENSLSNSQLPKLPISVCSNKVLESSDFSTPQRQNSIKSQNFSNNILNINDSKMEKPRTSVKRNSEKIEKENANASKSYLKRPKFILKQKEMFHYGDKLHDLIEKEKKDYIQKKNLGKNGEEHRETPVRNNESANNANISK